MSPTLRVARASRPEGTRVRVGGVEIGGPGFVVMAGLCVVEGLEQTQQTASAVSAASAQVLRGGVSKPRTRPYSFQGMGEPGLRVLSEVSRRVGLPIISEVMDASQLPLMEEHVHARPEQVLCDGQQALTPERFQQLMRRLPGVLGAVDRSLWRPEVPAHAVGSR